MKKTLIFSVLLSFFLFSCKDPELTKKVAELEKSIAEKDKQIEGLTDLAMDYYLNEIQADSLSFEETNKIRTQWGLPTYPNPAKCYSDCYWSWRTEKSACNSLPQNQRAECRVEALAAYINCKKECK